MRDLILSHGSLLITAVLISLIFVLCCAYRLFAFLKTLIMHSGVGVKDRNYKPTELAGRVDEIDVSACGRGFSR